MKQDKDDKALFIQRVAAYLIDMIIIMMVASLVASPFIDSKSVTKLNESSAEIIDKYMKEEISEKTYFSEAMSISYQMAKQNGIYSLITIFLNILYFVVYQFYNNGQTIGKKLLKIKVVAEDGELSMNQMIFRSLIINSILVQMILMGFVIFASQRVYLSTTLILELLQYTIILVSGFMIMFNKSGKGLHDMIVHSRVIRTNL